MKARYLSSGDKALIAFTLLLLGGLSLGAYLLRNSVIKTISNNSQVALINEAETIQQSLEHAFISNEFNSAQQMVMSISNQSQINAIRILSPDGKVLFSSIPDEIGVHLDLQNPQCQSCHTDQNALTLSTQQQFINIHGEPILITANPLENKIACQGCHPNAGASLGVILIERETGFLADQLTHFSIAIGSGAGALFILLTAAAWIGFRRTVSQPLDALTTKDHWTALATREDKFGYLARQLNDLTSAIEEKDIQIEVQRRNFHALQSLSESIDVTLAPEKVLQLAIPKVQEVTGFNHIAMRLFETENRCFRLVAQIGMTPKMVDDLRCIPAEIGFTGDVYKTHRAAYTSDLSEDPRLESPSPVESGFRSLVSVPFLSGDRLMGSMELASKTSRVWQEDEIRWLELMGRSIGNVLHHIETINRLQGKAVIQERSRIAQEIHDGLAQLIGTMRIWAEDARLALQHDDIRLAQDDLQKIETSARDAYASLREEILGLRDTLAPGKGILSVMHELLSRYQRQWGIETRLHISHGLTENEGSLFISPTAEIQLLRIIQEALMNIRRHARANLVTVSLQEYDHCLRVEVRDNGQGFDPQAIPEDKLGLRIIRERAASIGATVSIHSVPGDGTRVILELPKTDLNPPSITPTGGMETS
ncbi:MAG: GAF domain-containing sensor histidine kinase [Anaerolineales bacterium]|nr:GAF domain-containing sensor histidine kinase [Anaerolineales bacterium]